MVVGLFVDYVILDSDFDLRGFKGFFWGLVIKEVYFIKWFL